MCFSGGPFSNGLLALEGHCHELGGQLLLVPVGIGAPRRGGLTQLAFVNSSLLLGPLKDLKFLILLSSDLLRLLGFNCITSGDDLQLNVPLFLN